MDARQWVLSNPFGADQMLNFIFMLLERLKKLVLYASCISATYMSLFIGGSIGVFICQLHHFHKSRGL